MPSRRAQRRFRRERSAAVAARIQALQDELAAARRINESAAAAQRKAADAARSARVTGGGDRVPQEAPAPRLVQ